MSIGWNYGGHDAIRQRALRVDEGLHGVGHHQPGSQDVALNRIEDVRPRHLALRVLRDVAVAEPRVPGAPPLQIDDTELACLKRGILAQHLDDAGGMGTLLQLTEHEHLVRVRTVHGGLARGHTLPRYDHGLHAHQELIVAIDAGGRRDDDTARAPVDGDHRPGGPGRRG